jgi:hypothetical protein
MQALTIAFCNTVQIIQRLGRWQMTALQKSYLTFFKPEGLLVLAGWKEAAQKDFSKFWTERFCVDVPSVLVEAVFPFLRELSSQVEALGPAASTSMRSLPQVLQYLAVVLVQDALELAKEYPAHPVNVLLKTHPAFGCAPIIAACHCPANVPVSTVKTLLLRRS